MGTLHTKSAPFPIQNAYKGGIHVLRTKWMTPGNCYGVASNRPLEI